VTEGQGRPQGGAIIRPEGDGFVAGGLAGRLRPRGRLLKAAGATRRRWAEPRMGLRVHAGKKSARRARASKPGENRGGVALRAETCDRARAPWDIFVEPVMTPHSLRWSFFRRQPGPRCRLAGRRRRQLGYHVTVRGARGWAGPGTRTRPERRGMDDRGGYALGKAARGEAVLSWYSTKGKGDEARCANRRLATRARLIRPSFGQPRRKMGGAARES